MPKTWRGALIGAGHVALEGHLPGWSSRRDVAIAAATDARGEARGAVSAALPQAVWHDSLESLLSSEPLDFLDICTPPDAHGAAILAGLERGLHVLCEKPLVLDREELVRLKTLSEERGLVLASVHNWKHAPGLERAGALVRQGAIGRVRNVVWEVTRTEPSAAAPAAGASNWRLDPSRSGGGILVDHGWHAVYMAATWLAGRLRSVSGRLETRKHHRWPVEDTADVRLAFDGGDARLFLTWAGEERRNRVTIEGTAGTIRIDGASLELETGREEASRREYAPSLSDGSHHPDWFAGVADDFVSAMSRGRASASLAEAAVCLEAILLAQESSRRGGKRIQAFASGRDLAGVAAGRGGGR
ncbi:MAG: Gfo/Idh/MocA family oxidoreductase [Acidobacteria bacterium]|nr:Gfo/Idh/MocA family oxidoreductase [Acidobacteriota bacterium]MCA1609920.1 Gfo/Idh/MocA family oxidoreductase [Acidobacteriota bacterium]